MPNRYSVPTRGMSEAEKLDFYSIPVPECGCHIWIGAIENGYGVMVTNKHRVRSHRLAWELANGPILNGLHVLHKCDEPSCVNPDHLFLGTNNDNIADKIAKRRHSHGENHIGAKLNEADVRKIREASGSQREIAEQFGVHVMTINRIRNLKTWKHVA